MGRPTALMNETAWTHADDAAIGSLGEIPGFLRTPSGRWRTSACCGRQTTAEQSSERLAGRGTADLRVTDEEPIDPPPARHLDHSACFGAPQGWSLAQQVVVDRCPSWVTPRCRADERSPRPESATPARRQRL